MRVRGLLCAVLLALLGLAGCMAVSDGADADGQADLRRRADIRLELANAYFADGKLQIALQEVDRALALEPRRADALGLRGLVLQQLGEPASAIASLQQALRYAPDDPALLNNTGWVLCESGQAARSLEYFDRALAQRQYASPAKAAMNAGLCSVKLGERGKAAAYFRRALQAEPGLVAAHAKLARFAFEEGDLRGARAHLLPVITSEQVSAEDFLMAIRVEQALGDRAAEQSLASQWQRRLPDSPLWRDYQIGITDGR